MSRAGVTLLAAVALMGGCVAPPSGEQRPPVYTSRLGAAVTGPQATLADDDRDEAATLGEREARAAALRLRVTGPQVYGAGVGSGFAVDGTTVITNAHVVDDGSEVTMTSWDGHDVDATATDTTVRHDLAVLTTDERVPVTPLALAADDPAEGDDVVVVGFPGGGRITVDDDAEVLGVVDGGDFAQQLPAELVLDKVVRLDADSVRPGSSGGPVLNSSGEVVGVVYAIVVHGDREALAVPVTTLRGWLADR